MPRDVSASSIGSGAALAERLTKKKILSRRMSPPPVAAWEPLATILDGLHWNASSATADHEARQEVDRAKERFQTALLVLAEAAPILLQRYMALANSHMIKQTADLARARVGALRSLDELIPQVQSLFLEADAPSYLHWHHYAVGLADAFRAAIRVTNPSHPLGMSPRGPVVRFLAEVAIPHVSGERLQPDAISKYLKRNSH